MKSKQKQVAVPTLKAELARRGMPQWRLAKKLGYAPSSFSDLVRGVRPMPAELVDRIERVLELAPGTLTTNVKE